MMQNTTIEINGNTYRINRLPAMQSMHIDRKLARVLPRLLPLLLALLKTQGGAPEDGESGHAADPMAMLSMDTTMLAEAAQPLADALADMPNDDMEYVVNTLMSQVMMKQGNSWASAWSADTGDTMFDGTVTKPVIWQLVLAGLKLNLAGFTFAGITSLFAAPQEA